MLTVRDAAERLKVNEKTIRRLVFRGEIEHVRVGRAIRISPAQLEAFVSANTHRRRFVAEQVA